MSRALVVSGGGSKGAFAVGVIKYLAAHYPDSHFDMYVGTSTGSLIVPLAAMNKMALLEEMYTTKQTKDIIQKFDIGDRLSKNSILGVDPLWELIKSNYTDDFYEELRASGKPLFLNTTCLQTEDLVVFSTIQQQSTDHYTSREIERPDQFRKAVLASANQPVFMPPVKVNLDLAGAKDQHYQYVDGGVREYAGIEIAIQNGATEIVAILLSSDAPVTLTGEYKDIYSILERTIEIFTTDVGKNDLVIPQQYNEALKYIDAVKRKMRRAGISKEEVDEYFRTSRTPNPFQDKLPLTIHIIRPSKPLGGGPGGLDFVPADMKKMLSSGEQRIKEYIADLENNGKSWL